MRYTILKYTQPEDRGKFLDPIRQVYNSFEAAEERIQYRYISGQSFSSNEIITTDDSLKVWQSVRHRHDFVIILREDNPFFGITSLIFGILLWHKEPFKHYWSPLFEMIRDYLCSISTQPELFKP